MHKDGIKPQKSKRAISQEHIHINASKIITKNVPGDSLRYSTFWMKRSERFAA